MSRVSAQMRPVEDIEPHEWAKLERAKRISNTRKLAALLPKWLKLELFTAPEPFKPDLRVVVRSWATVQLKYVPKIPQSAENTQGYIRQYEKLNGLKSVQSLRHTPGRSRAHAIR